ncbi:MAG: condensation domain-containing protein [Clostridia bacterium]|nr:condensation domain-containing protein [Clostridia bacterium]
MFERTLPSGEKVNAYPITTPQQFMLFMSLQYGVGYPINNIGSGYYWKGEMDFDLMKESVEEAISRCDTMRLRFMPDEQYKVMQYITPKSEMEIETWDYSDMTLEEAHEKLLAFSRGPIPMYYCEIHTIKLMKLAEGYNGIFMKLNHLAMDAFSVKVFLRDIMEIYLHKLKGTPYPKPMRPYEKALLGELAYLKSEQYEIDKKYWEESLSKASEPIFTDYMLESRLKEQRKEHPTHRFADIHTGSPAAKAKIFDMTEEETNALSKMCEENDLSLCAALSMGVRTTLSVFNDNEEDVSFKMIVDRRGNLLEKKSGGIRINFFPMRSIVTEDMTAFDSIREIMDVQNEIYSHCSLSFAEMLQERHKSMPADAKPDSTYDSVGFSYQPLMIVPNIDEETARSAKGVWYNNGASMIPLYLTARHRANDGGLEFIFEYRLTPDPEHDLDVFFETMRKSLNIIAKNPKIKVGDLLKECAVEK